MKVDATKFSGKKSKAAAKKGPGATQYEILAKSGIPAEEIASFRCARICARALVFVDFRMCGCV